MRGEREIDREKEIRKESVGVHCVMEKGEKEREGHRARVPS